MKPKFFLGFSVISAFLLSVSVTSGMIAEYYRDPLDQLLGTKSWKIETEATDNEDEMWNFKSEFKTAKEAYEGWKEFAIREANETMVLLKNKDNALPLATKTPKVTMMGLRSYAPVYGNSGGSIADFTQVTKEPVYEIMKNKGFQLNPSMLGAYQEYFKDKEWGGAGFGATPPEYKAVTKTDEVCELSPTELAALKADYQKDYASYNDAAIVVLGRPGGEQKEFNIGSDGTKSPTTTNNITGLSDEEKAILKEAKDHFSKVIVLINSTISMEIKELEDDPDIDAVMWIGYPGAYGFNSICDILTGEVNPSAYMGDIYVTNNAVAPSMQSFGNIPWANASSFTAEENVNSYLVEAEGIYSGYRYYETRYADIVNGVSSAKTAKEGTYTSSDGKLATTSGEWNYDNEVVYPFGYGLSYTTFEQKLDSVKISGDKKSAEVTVTVTNTGDVKGKKAVQLYAQTPYTEYDKKNNVEKSAIQLMDFEKTKELAPDESQTITMDIDMSNIASYDYTTAKTFIVDDGTYYFALGDNSHDALNNVFAKQGKSTKDGMDYDGNKDLVYSWTWSDFDKDTFSVSENNVNITNKLTEGDYAMDLNNFMKDEVTYLSRSDWNGTFPKSYDGISANDALTKLLKNDFIPLKNNDDTSEYKWGVESELTLNDLKGASWDDPRWEELINKVTIEEFLTFAQNAFHHIQEIPSVGYQGNDADDGPGGSDTHYLETGTYRGETYSDGKDYTKTGSRVCPSQQNLAYSWNKELAYENGELILGESSLVFNIPIVIGPGMNLHRNGLNGRGGEYYSEDPVLSGYIGSASVQGAQSKGCLVNIKHAGFNDQEINRSGIAVFMNEQKARELELRNLKQAFVAKGKPASFKDDASKENTYKEGALGVMTSYNRIGAVASSANKAVMVDIMREEWGFKGYNVTDFTGVSLKAAPKESILFGTTAFCGFGKTISYWNADSFKNDKDMCKAIKENIKYILYPLANSNALNGINSTSHRVELMTSWRAAYISCEAIFGTIAGASLLAYIVFSFIGKKKGAK